MWHIYPGTVSEIQQSSWRKREKIERTFRENEVKNLVVSTSKCAIILNETERISFVNFHEFRSTKISLEILVPPTGLSIPYPGFSTPKDIRPHKRQRKSKKGFCLKISRSSSFNLSFLHYCSYLLPF